MTRRTGVVLAKIGALVAAIAGVIVAVPMAFAVNSGEPVPVYLPSLIVVSLLLTAALLGLATTMQRKLPPHRR
jgi:ABC-type antimicrobial peptide transport system permease subunit